MVLIAVLRDVKIRDKKKSFEGGGQDVFCC
jgi:hypothetical protein